jgi:hypothetical protein
VLFYADKVRPLDTLETIAEVSETLRRSARCYRGHGSAMEAAVETHTDIVGASMSLGELHQAVADLLNPDRDELLPEVDRLASAGVALGRCVYRSSRNLRDPSTHPGSMADLLEIAAADVSRAAEGLPAGPLQARIPEGYAFYCLYPEMYLASLGKVLESHPSCPAWTVVGVRSIGTSLAAIIAGALFEIGFPARVETLRPRGHPFNRHVEMGALLRDRLAVDIRSGNVFLVVDEGPGLTCSSLVSVCTALDQLGLEDTRIAILSAWRGAPSIFASDDGRRRWGQLRVFYTEAAEALDGWRGLLPFIEAALPTQLHEGSAPEILDISYGRWRQLHYPSEDRWPVVHRSTERTKLLIRHPSLSASALLLPRGEGGAGETASPFPHGQGGGHAFWHSHRGSMPILAKFAGLGRYGRGKYQRAVTLAEAGFAPPVAGLAYGFLLYPFLERAQPLDATDLSPALVTHMVRYYAFVARRFPVSAAARFEPLTELILVNAREGLGIDASNFVERWRPRQHDIDRLPLALIDGKPQPHEWLRVGSVDGPAYLKADADDHFLDHTLVGEQSILWDLAGACEEWEMSKETRSDFLARWEGETGDRQAGDLLDFYRAAYLAFRIAALHYAVHSTNEEEIRQSLQHQQWMYAQRLAPLLRIEL